MPSKLVVTILQGGREWPIPALCLESGPTGGKYRVDVNAVDRICEAAFQRARGDGDFVVNDEVALMEVLSEVPVRRVHSPLDAETPAVAALHYGSTEGIVGDVKARVDAETYEVTGDTRDDLPERPAEFVLEAVNGQYPLKYSALSLLNHEPPRSEGIRIRIQTSGLPAPRRRSPRATGRGCRR